MPRAAILVVEKDDVLRAVMEEHLSAGGYKVHGYADLPKEIFDKTEETFDVDCMIIATSVKGAEPGTLLSRYGGRTPLIFVSEQSTGQSAIPEIVDAIRNGAADYLIKPVDGVTLMRSVHRALRYRVLERRVRRLESENAQLAGRDGGLIGRSEVLLRILQVIERIAPSSSPVLILGETGAGKELVAREIHCKSGRSGDFVAVNAASLGENLFEAELFGYEPGAFTGAKGRKLGLVEVADGGTLFLDEIGDLSPQVQARLLRFLDDGRFRRVGGLREVETDVRIVAATNRDLEQSIADMQKLESSDAGAARGFRSDLFYRLAAFTLKLPPLRERTTDIPLLIDHFIRLFEAKTGRPAPTLAPGVNDLLMKYTWPGNVREFRNFIDRMLFTYSDKPEIEAGMASELLPKSSSVKTNPPAAAHSWKEHRTSQLAETDRAFLAEVMRRNNFNISAAAREMGIDRKTLSHRIRELNIVSSDKK
ncbi:MAG: sigma-54 dependent transcriptional regulator [Candidatus Hydrogenedentota bacterium]